jgi:signal transduction histidine kinase
MTGRAIGIAGSRRAWLRVAAVVAAAGLGATMLVVNAGRGPLALGSVLEVLVGLSFTACGAFIWGRRPANRLGPLMIAVGLVWLIGRTMTLVEQPLVFTTGIWLSDVWSVGFALFLLSFPAGRLLSTLDRAIVGVFLFVTVPLEFLWLLFWVPDNGLNVLGIAADENAAHVIDTIQRFTIAFGAMLLVLALGRRWSRASGPVRRQMTPVLVGAAAILLGSLGTVLFTFGIELEWLLYGMLIAHIAIPVAVLVVLLRARMARGAVADLVVELGRTPTPARLRDALANALGDPSLRVAYWSPLDDAFVDADGSTVTLPDPESGQAITMLERDGVGEAAIIHDAALLEEPGLIASVASAMRLAVENDRLTAAVEEQLSEVRASRARIVAAGDIERRRVERDLHDGAQQRLVALTLALRLARSRLGDDADPAVRQSLEQAAAEAKAALAELRELARGIHPQILTEAGLEAAIESLAARAPIAVEVEIAPGIRFDPEVEAVAYFVAAEALTNVAKYANATLARIAAGWVDGRLVVEVADDGLGGADPAAGTGLRGLIDRLSAVDGALEVISPRGGGTRLIARIPSAAPHAMPPESPLEGELPARAEVAT